MTEKLITKLIANSAVAGDMESVATLTDMLNDLRNPVVEKKTRKSPNKSGYVQIDPETGKEVARFATVKEANLALEKKETASNISDACRNFQTGHSNMAWGYKWCYGSDFDAQ